MSRKKDDDKDEWIQVTCPTCGGSGRRGNGICNLCNGTGKIWVIK